MVFAYDSEMSLQAAVELVNSAVEPDTLTSVAELDEFWTRWRYTGRHDRTRAELDAVRALRPRLRELLTADRDRAVVLVNQACWQRSRCGPQLVRHDGLRLAPPRRRLRRRPLADRIAVETAMAMIDVIRADETSRLAVCADDGCDGVVLDLSRNRSRRYCSTTCANRNAVAAYRARQRGVSRPQARNRRSTSVKTSGCSECTQWPAPLTVTRRFLGNSRSIASAYSSLT